MNIIKRLKNAEVVFIAYHYSPSGGSCVSANHFFNHWSLKGRKIEKVSKDSRFGLFKVALAFFFAKKIVLNGLYCFNFYDLIFFSYIRRDIVVFLQESEYAIQEFSKKNVLKYFFFKAILKRNKIACISRVQEAYLKKLAAKSTYMLYNTLPFLPKKDLFNTNSKKILMVGYLMERKGVDLYSHLADYAKENGEDWAFFWVGDGADTGLYKSINVHWLGLQSSPHYFYDKVDLFFLSSIDEPFGLVCAEALMHYKKCVVYKNAGFAEFIENMSGCALYNKYEVEDAYNAIKKALATPLDKEKAEDMLNKVSSIEAFSERLDHIFEG